MPDDLRLEDGTLIDGDELSVSFVRSGGPGGQHVNTSATRVELRFDVHASASLGPVQKQRVVDALGNRLTRDGALVVRVSDFRSQARNREVARTRLAALLSRALRPARPRRATRVPRSSRRRRLDAKRRRSDRKQLRRRPDAP